MDIKNAVDLLYYLISLNIVVGLIHFILKHTTMLPTTND